MYNAYNKLLYIYYVQQATSATYQTRSKDVRHIDTKECQTEISIEVITIKLNKPS